MELSQAAARLWVRDGEAEEAALAATTDLAVGAHPDDVEIMALHPIAAALGGAGRRFAAVIVSDGGGSPRAGRYAGVSDDEMRALRLAEQRKAAAVGDYGALICLGFTSAAVRAGDPALAADLGAILAAAAPEAVYTHSPFDAHDTHVAVALRVIAAARALPAERRPRALYGCEVWGGLDWLPADRRRRFDVSDSEHLGAALLGVHDSQIAGGKRYDLAVAGRRRAHATFADPGETDRAEAVDLACDLTPLVRDPSLDVEAWSLSVIGRFADDVALRLRRLRGGGGG